MIKIFRRSNNELLRQYKAIQKTCDRLETLVVAQQAEFQQYWMSSRVTTGNKYKTHKLQVEEAIKKYIGAADSGKQLAQRIINMRVAFSVPNRLVLVRNSKVESTDKQYNECKAFLKDFMAINMLDGSLPKDLAKEAELQGQVVLRLNWNVDLKNVVIEYYPWNKTGYIVKPVEDQKFYLNPALELKYTGNDNRPVDVKDDEFVFIAFNDLLHEFEGYPTIGGVLEQTEDLDKDLQDWRILNYLFAHPTPHFKCESVSEANAINDMIKTNGWRCGKALATNSDFELKGTTGVEANLLMLSIQTRAKVISGHTGISIHFLGFANVMSNRATADSAGEPTEIVLHSEITSWQMFYNELFAKVIRMRNEKLNSKLLENVVKPKLTPLTDRQWQAIKDVWMPLANKGHISEKTLLEKIPDIDPDEEVERLEEEEAKAGENKKIDGKEEESEGKKKSKEEGNEKENDEEGAAE